jgi:DNA topoisomerase-1
MRGGSLTLRFRAKSGVDQELTVADARLVRRLRTCKRVPGRALFQYLDDGGQPHGIAAADINGYLQAAAGTEFSAKDFRTWVGTLEAARALDAAEQRGPRSMAERKRELLRALDEVATRLGNTRAVCRKCYVHPAILEKYFEGRTLSAVRPHESAGGGLAADERALLALLETTSRARRRAS